MSTNTFSQSNCPTFWGFSKRFWRVLFFQNTKSWIKLAKVLFRRYWSVKMFALGNFWQPNALRNGLNRKLTPHPPAPPSSAFINTFPPFPASMKYLDVRKLSLCRKLADIRIYCTWKNSICMNLPPHDGPFTLV